MSNRTYYHYSESFKREVVRRVQAGDFGIVTARRHYGIGSGNSIRKWIKKYGNPGLFNKKVIIMNAKEQTKEKRQAQRIKELEKALVELQLKHLEAESYLSLACKELGEEAAAFKKKVKGQDSD